MSEHTTPTSPSAANRAPGVCVPWEEKRQEFPKIMGDEAIVKRTWEENDQLAYMFIWHCLLSF